MTKILISACLLGQPVRYDGQGKRLDHWRLDQWRREGRLLGFCPEQAAGLPTPRPAAEIRDGMSGESVMAGRARVVESSGADVTAAFIAAAQKTLEFAQRHDCRHALLIDGSPSCGTEFIYDGSFSGQKHAGAGVTASLLRENGIKVFSPRQIEALAAAIADEA